MLSNMKSHIYLILLDIWYSGCNSLNSNGSWTNATVADLPSTRPWWWVVTWSISTVIACFCTTLTAFVSDLFWTCLVRENSIVPNCAFSVVTQSSSLGCITSTWSTCHKWPSSHKLKYPPWSNTSKPETEQSSSSLQTSKANANYCTVGTLKAMEKDSDNSMRWT